MFVLLRETLVDGYFGVFDTLLVCSDEKAKLERLVSAFYEEKESFLKEVGSINRSLYESGKTRLDFDSQQELFSKYDCITKYFKNYLDVCSDFNFEIQEIHSI